MTGMAKDSPDIFGSTIMDFGENRMTKSSHWDLGRSVHADGASTLLYEALTGTQRASRSLPKFAENADLDIGNFKLKFFNTNFFKVENLTFLSLTHHMTAAFQLLLTLFYSKAPT
jgi:hypothetical protein